MIKSNKYFNLKILSKNKIKFLKVWLNVFINNPAKYFKAYAMATYGFWSIGTKSDYGFTCDYIYPPDNNYDIKNTDYIQKFTGINMKEFFKQGSKQYIGAGTIFAILLITIYLLTISKKFEYIICLLPVIGTWISIFIATPVAFSLRYVFVGAYSLPFIIILPMMKKNNENKI